MPYLDKIVKELNEHLLSQLRVKNNPVQSLGIAQVIPTDQGRSMPVILPNNRDGEVAVFDDRYEMTLYHVVESVRYDDEEGFGEELMKTEEASMTLICYCDPYRLKITKQDILSIVASKINLTAEISIADQTLQSIIKAESINTNSSQVWSDQYSGYEYAAPPEHLLFSVRYSIHTAFDASCINACAVC